MVAFGHYFLSIQKWALLTHYLSYTHIQNHNLGQTWSHYDINYIWQQLYVYQQLIIFKNTKNYQDGQILYP